jgi:hypothetical protein
MKGVLIGADFLKINGEYKLLEINTDVDIYTSDLKYLEVESLFNYLTTNSYTKLVVIYKQVHVSQDVLNFLQIKATENGITFDSILIPNNSITIPSITEEANTFYFRCAYDVTAIIDDTYCRDKSEIVNLLTQSDNLDILPKTYVKYTMDDSILDNIDVLPDNGNLPNVIVKKILPDFDRKLYPAFHKIDDLTDLAALKTSLNSNLMAQEFNYDSNNLSDGSINDVIRFWVVLLQDVETMLPLGGHFTKNQLELDDTVITYSGNVLDNKWRSMFFSNPNMVSIGVPGTYEIIKIDENDEEIVTTLNDIQIGEKIKSVSFSNLSTSASMSETLYWSSSAPINEIVTYSTASVNNKNVISFEGWLTEIEYVSGSLSGSSMLPNNEVILVRDGVNNAITFKPIIDIDLSDTVITSNNSELDVTDKNNIWYSGSIVTIDIEPDDVFVAGTDLNDINRSSVGNLLVHNKCVQWSWCCFGDDTIIATEYGDVKIENVKIGDMVWSYNFGKKEKELKKVLQIQNPHHEDIVEVKFSNNVTIKNTFDHPYYNEKGELMSYRPEKTMQWFNGEVKQLRVGEKCQSVNGEMVTVQSIIKSINNIRTRTLFVEDNNNFYANGILVYDEKK